MAIDPISYKRQVISGWVAGLLSPLLGYYIFTSLYFKNMPLAEVFEMFCVRNVLPHVISLSVIVNLVLFFTFLKMNKDYAARGVLGATFIYVFIVVYLKFL